MNRGGHRTTGFTIVELLIVVVVIAILAAITVVAYNGISNSANDSALRSDLASMGKKVQLTNVQTGSYPAGGRATSDGTTFTGLNNVFPGFKFSVAKQSYDLSAPSRLSYCQGPNSTTGAQEFRFLARSKSGRYFEYTSFNGLADRGTAYLAIYEHYSLCEGIGYPRSHSVAYDAATGWADWAQ